jgi:hypothetical protein
MPLLFLLVTILYCRNPWRCSFDKAALGEPVMYCGDVGQDRVEKVIYSTIYSIMMHTVL